jgi:hypothetical protein
MASSLFYFGEIGFNDYSFALLNVLSNDTVSLAESLVPHVVGAIRSALLVSTVVILPVNSAHRPVTVDSHKSAIKSPRYFPSFIPRLLLPRT